MKPSALSGRTSIIEAVWFLERVGVEMARILIADDEESIRDIVSFYAHREGHESVTVKDGEAAVEAFSAGGFDLVILDVMMPARNGFEVCAALRAIDDDVPIVMLSAKGDIVDKSMGFGAGADDYITKPFDPEELVLRINSCLRRHGSKSAAVPAGRIVLDDLVICPKEREVSVGGNRVVLTAKEFDILNFMAQYPGAVFSRAQILDAVWGADHVGDSGVVAVFVRRLREKIESDSSHPRHILTEWGAGYRLV